METLIQLLLRTTKPLEKEWILKKKNIRTSPPESELFEPLEDNTWPPLAFLASFPLEFTPKILIWLFRSPKEAKMDITSATEKKNWSLTELPPMPVKAPSPNSEVLPESTKLEKLKWSFPTTSPHSSTFPAGLRIARSSERISPPWMSKMTAFTPAYLSLPVCLSVFVFLSRWMWE